MLDLDGVSVRDVEISAGLVRVEVGLRRRRLVCPHCDYSTAAVYDRRPVRSRWRHLDLGLARCDIVASLRRLDCPTHGVVTEGVPFARPGSGFTGIFENLIAYLVTKTDKSTIAEFCRIAWRTVGAIVGRVGPEYRPDLDALKGLVSIGVDEISWRKHHKYLTIVTDHLSAAMVWGSEGKSAAAFGEFFDEIGEESAQNLDTVSADLGAAYHKTIAAHAPQATICADPFHVIALANKAVDTVRRTEWQQLRRADPAAAKKMKGLRFALLKDRSKRSTNQNKAMNILSIRKGKIWRAFQLKEALRDILKLDDPTLARDQLRRWRAWAQRSRLEPFVRLGRTIEAHFDKIIAAIEHGLSNSRAEALNNKIRLITRRGYGFHSAQAALDLALLTCGPNPPPTPHQNPFHHPHLCQ